MFDRLGSKAWSLCPERFRQNGVRQPRGEFNLETRPLCRACLSLPFRSILRLRGGDCSIRDTFTWVSPKYLPNADITQMEPYIRWHDNISQLREGHKECAFCHAIFYFLQDSYHYHANIKPGEERRVWLSVPSVGGTPTLTVYIGDAAPEIMISGRYRFSTTPDSPVSQFFDDHAAIKNPLHPVVLEKMKSWVEGCNEDHPKCTRTKNINVPLPTRLLDLSSLPTRKDIRRCQEDPRDLFNAESFKLVENVPNTGQYIALSYCWGKGLPYTTRRGTLQKHKQEGIQYAHLPKTLQDAIFIVRYLGVRYLWADCVCIVQNDRADWEHEAARMADVYSKAYLTIAATRASHCGEGFLQARKSKKTQQSVRLKDKKGSFELYFEYDDLTTAPGSMESVHQPLRLRKDEPLLERGWCFQERVLATRTLHFASDQMYWECAQKFEQEKGWVVSKEDEFYQEYSLGRIASGLRNGDKPEVPNQGRDAWFRVVEEYTSRDLSNQSDKLPALSGVIDALQKELPNDKCYAGIWRSWFLRGLFWRLQVPGDLYAFAPKQSQKADFWRAPSWSFASVEGVVLYKKLDEAELDGWKPCARLVECSITPKGSNPLGELKSGFARIEAPLTSVINVERNSTRKGRACLVRLQSQNATAAHISFDFDYYESCKALMITPHGGIAVVLADMDKDTYVRVGTVSVDPLWNAVEFFLSAHPPDRFLTASAFPEPTCITLL